MLAHKFTFKIVFQRERERERKMLVIELLISRIVLPSYDFVHFSYCRSVNSVDCQNYIKCKWKHSIMQWKIKFLHYFFILKVIFETFLLQYSKFYSELIRLLEKSYKNLCMLVYMQRKSKIV